MGLLATTDEFLGSKCAADGPEMSSGSVWLKDVRSGILEGRRREEKKMGTDETQAGGNKPVKRIPDWGIRADRLSPAP
jgi:hypothetical protein